MNVERTHRIFNETNAHVDDNPVHDVTVVRAEPNVLIIVGKGEHDFERFLLEPGAARQLAEALQTAAS
jgi:hypothetical protein